MVQFPSRLLFEVAADCPYVDRPFSLAPSEWGPALPPLSELDGTVPFAEVYVAWNEQGLYVAAQIPKDGPLVGNRRRPASGDGMQLWVDTRPEQSGYRATQYCHHFVILPRVPGSDEPLAWQQNIRRAWGRPPLCNPEEIKVEMQRAEGYYLLRVGLDTEVLNGFPLQADQQIGFNYLVHDTAAGRQLWSCPPQVPYDRNPPFWGRLRLVR